MLITYTSKRHWRSFLRFCKNHSLYSGLIPTTLLIVFILIGISQTTTQISLLNEQLRVSIKQISLLSEQLRVSLPPVLHIHTKLSRGITEKFSVSISNLGKDTTDNVNIQMDLLLVNERDIYSYGQHRVRQAYYGGTTRTPREKIWPRLTLKPNDEHDLSPRIPLLLIMAYQFPPKKDNRYKDLIAIQQRLKGIYVVAIYYSFRRRYDLLEASDTTFIVLSPILGIMGSLQSEIGGVGTIKRIKHYLQDGPERSINITKDSYIIYKHELDGVIVEKTIERKL